MLNDRINELIKEIDATKLAISEYADIDRTSISHGTELTNGTSPLKQRKYEVSSEMFKIQFI